MKKFLPLFVVFLLFGFKHPFYLGVCDFKYKPAEKLLQGSVKLFISDLEQVLSKQQGQKTDLIHPKDSLFTSKIIRDYLKSRLFIEINGQKQKYNYLGFETEAEVCWIYLEVKSCPVPKSVLISNTLLYDFSPQQMNIVHFESAGDKKSLKVLNPEKELKFEF